MNDRLTESNVRQYFKPMKHLGETILCFDEIGFMNTYLKEPALEGGLVWWCRTLRDRPARSARARSQCGLRNKNYIHSSGNNGKGESHA